MPDRPISETGLPGWNGPPMDCLPTASQLLQLTAVSSKDIVPWNHAIPMDIYLVYSFVSWHFFASTSVSYCLRFAPTPC